VVSKPDSADGEEARGEAQVGRPLVGNTAPEVVELPGRDADVETSSVIAIAKTPSLNASVRPVSQRPRVRSASALMSASPSACLLPEKIEISTRRSRHPDRVIDVRGSRSA
jgi:hypothetical protein